MLTFRKTREGKWAAFGPVTELQVGEVTLHKADGSTKKVTVKAISKSFDDKGVQCAFGILGENKPASWDISELRKPVTLEKASNRRYECPECGEYVFAGTRCWETGCTH